MASSSAQPSGKIKSTHAEEAAVYAQMRTKALESKAAETGAVDKVPVSNTSSKSMSESEVKRHFRRLDLQSLKLKEEARWEPGDGQQGSCSESDAARRVNQF